MWTRMSESVKYGCENASVNSQGDLTKSLDVQCSCWLNAWPHGLLSMQITLW